MNVGLRPFCRDAAPMKWFGGRRGCSLFDILVVVKIMVPFWVPEKIRCRTILGTPKGIIILTTTRLECIQACPRGLQAHLSRFIGRVGRIVLNWVLQDIELHDCQSLMVWGVAPLPVIECTVRHTAATKSSVTAAMNIIDSESDNRVLNVITPKTCNCLCMHTTS